MPTAAIIGAGLIGRSWALVFSRAGWSVRVTDSSAAAVAKTKHALAEMAASAGEDKARIASIVERVSVFGSLAEALDGAELIQECGPEDVEIKRELFVKLDQIADPRAIIASSSSAIVISRVSETLPGRARCLVAHPTNPPHLIPLVELCGASWTSAETIDRAFAFYSDVRQTPIVIKKEIDGFVLNRLQVALVTEALRLVGNGVVSAQDLDKTISEGLGLRWSFMGPFATIELNAPAGIRDYCARFGEAFSALVSPEPADKAWAPANVDRVMASWGSNPSPEEIADRSQWRNRRLAALRVHKSAQPTPERP